MRINSKDLYFFCQLFSAGNTLTIMHTRTHIHRGSSYMSCSVFHFFLEQVIFVIHSPPTTTSVILLCLFLMTASCLLVMCHSYLTHPLLMCYLQILQCWEHFLDASLCTCVSQEKFWEVIFLRECVASLVTQSVKNLPAVQETWVPSLGWEDPLEMGMATHFQHSCLENPMDRGTWWATVHGLAQSWTWLSD